LSLQMRSVPVSKYLKTARCAFENMLAGEAIYPFYCSFKVTRRCNFNCSFCNCWHVKTRWKDIPTEDVMRILDNVARSSIIVCSLEGGDPLLRDDIEQILRYQASLPFYLLFTTSERRLGDRYPMEEYGKYIDFLHISIDEGHENLDMYDDLEDFTRWGPIICVQIVVTKDTVDDLEWKIKRCKEANVKAVVMAAVHLSNTQDHLPDLQTLARKGLELREKYPGVIISPKSYFKSITKAHGCDTTSIIIDADGGLFYPCRTLEEKTINMARSDLMEYLVSPAAMECRRKMAECDLKCAWYQYFATKSFVEPTEIVSAISPYVQNLVNGGRQAIAARPH